MKKFDVYINEATEAVVLEATGKPGAFAAGAQYAAKNNIEMKNLRVEDHVEPEPEAEIKAPVALPADYITEATGRAIVAQLETLNRKAERIFDLLSDMKDGEEHVDVAKGDFKPGPAGTIGVIRGK